MRRDRHTRYSCSWMWKLYTIMTRLLKIFVSYGFMKVFFCFILFFQVKLDLEFVFNWRITFLYCNFNKLFHMCVLLSVYYYFISNWSFISKTFESSLDILTFIASRLFDAFYKMSDLMGSSFTSFKSVYHESYTKIWLVFYSRYLSIWWIFE